MATITVSNSGQLKAAIASAKGGDLILMKPGDYDVVKITDKSFSSNVTIASADPKKLAHIDQLIVDNVENLTIKQIDFGRALEKGESKYTRWVDVDDSSNITFDGVKVHGSLDGNPGNDAYGMRVSDSKTVNVINSEFQQLGRAIVFNKVTDIDVIGNHIHHIRSDGIDFAQVRSVLIDKNYLHDFYPVGKDHPDAIQFLTNGTTVASRDIRITNNVILQGDGRPSQGIFIKDETDKLPYENVHISNNLVYMNMYNGITVAVGKKVEVFHNTVLSPADNVQSRIWLRDVKGAKVEDNVADIFLNMNSTSVAATDNIFLRDTPGKASMIPNLNAGSDASVADLVVKGIGYQPNGVVIPAPSPTPPPVPVPVPVPPVPAPPVTAPPPKLAPPPSKNAAAAESPVSEAIGSALGEHFGKGKGSAQAGVQSAADGAAGEWTISAPADGAALLKSFVAANLPSAVTPDAVLGHNDPTSGFAALDFDAFGEGSGQAALPSFQDAVGMLFDGGGSVFV